MPEENTNQQERFVVDASYVLALVLSDERVTEVDLLFDRYARKEAFLFSTHLLPFEVVNSIVMAVKRKRVSDGEARLFVDRFIRLSIPCVPVAEATIYDVATRYGLSAYDASYMALAREHRAPLLTLDDRLKKLL